MKQRARVALGVALAVSLMAPAGLASSAALAADEEAAPVEQIAAAAVADEAAEPAETEPGGSRAAPPDTARAETEPRLPEGSGGSAQLLPPNTSRYVTVRVRDVNGDPVRSGTVLIQGHGERVIDSDGEAHYLSLPYGSYTFSANPSITSRPDLMGHSGQLDVGQEVHVFTVTLLSKPNVNAIGFRGTMTDASTGLPLVRGSIWVEPVDRSEPRFTASARAADGTYWITGLQQKPYSVIFESYGYASQYTILTPGASYPVHDPSLTPNRNLAMGLVTDPEGYPVQGATIELYDPATGAVAGTTSVLSTGHWEGHFNEANIDPGVYAIRVIPPAGTDLATTYYPGAYDPSQAVAVDFGPGELVKRIDIAVLGTRLSAVGDSYATPLNAELRVTGPASGLLDNDDGYRSLRVSGIQGVVNANSPDITRPTDRNGEVTVATDGTFTYFPPTDFEGIDTFTYMLRDEGPIASATATVRITVGDPAPDDPAPDEPVVLRDDAYSTPHGTAIPLHPQCDLSEFHFGGNDSGEIRSWQLVDDVQHGVLEFEDKGCFGYVPDPGFSGTDRFTYTADDDNGRPTGQTATVTITVGAKGGGSGGASGGGHADGRSGSGDHSGDGGSTRGSTASTGTGATATANTKTDTDAARADGLATTGDPGMQLGWGLALAVAGLCASGLLLAGRRVSGRPPAARWQRSAEARPRHE
ncbi:Ig-like domain-containing protein [Leucobacter celer]|uniref:Ig-like domain-containing protein n=1 Tax=Leucobacter celer TaxID=668625 RepID=UPI0006A7A25D|nr:Ig-like domain-containing protein [Leucobacter celer]